MLAASLCLSFPALLAQPSEPPTANASGCRLEILRPADASIAYTDPERGSADVHLEYSASRADRLCLDLLRGPVVYYRGPVRQASDRGMLSYATGCFAPSQPVLLQGLPQGSYVLRAALGGECNATSAFLILNATGPVNGGATAAAAAEFVPTYAWSTIGPTQSVPAGIEVRLALDGSHARTGRIPPLWRLQLPLGPGARSGFVRADVGRDTPLTEVEAAAALAAARHARRRLAAAGDAVGAVSGDARCFSMWDAGVRLPAESTVGEARVFARRPLLRLVPRQCAAVEAMRLGSELASAEASDTSKRTRSRPRRLASGSQPPTRGVAAKAPVRLDAGGGVGLRGRNASGGSGAAETKPPLEPPLLMPL